MSLSPWEDVIEAGWGPPFTAASVLMYLRQEEPSIESARWYWRRLDEFTKSQERLPQMLAHACQARLLRLLTKEEFGRLQL